MVPTGHTAQTHSILESMVDMRISHAGIDEVDNLNEVNNFGVYNFDSFNSKFKKIQGFMALHLNVRSLNKHMDDLTSFLNELEFEVDVLAISETWMTENSIDFSNIDGYQSFHQFRHEKRGGGVSLFVKDTREAKK